MPPKGYKLTEDQRLILRAGLRKFWDSHAGQIRRAKVGEQSKRLLAEGKMGHTLGGQTKLSPQALAKLKASYKNPERNEKIRKAKLGVSLPPLSNAHKASISRALKGRSRTFTKKWLEHLHESYRKPERLRKLFTRRGKSSTEAKFEMFLMQHKLPFRFVGCGEVLIDRKNPDFIHQNEKKVIEIFGNYWHTLDEIEPRVKFFADHGYKCLVFWESDLKTKSENEIVDLINQL